MNKEIKFSHNWNNKLFNRIFTTIRSCQYGDFRQKPTDIWTNAEHWNPKPKCSPGDTCHESAKRGADRGTQSLGGGGKKGSVERSRIPDELCDEIVSICT